MLFINQSLPVCAVLSQKSGVLSVSLSLPLLRGTYTKADVITWTKEVIKMVMEISASYLYIYRVFFVVQC